MIDLLAKIGRFNTVIIVTLIAVLAALGATLLAVSLLNQQGYGLHPGIAAILAGCIALLVALPIAWFLVDLLLRVYRDEQEMRNLASYDSLTGLLSRHAFFDNANNYVSLARREHKPFVVMIIDLDHFKLINDRYGHPAGDAVLKLFANITNSVARRSDIVGRLGGEEFAIVLPSTSTAKALEFAERLHAAINKAVLTFNDSAIKYTASIGLAEFDRDSADNIDELLARADLALYEAKQSGRNRTATFNPQLTQAAAG
ncbi:MAG TPA: GGDEF domain-containing protein [Gammaproteobacteria bacterium]|nr:GGDEF domain-containing protein [Gammaproteobacteria bacterium]